jgi:betaine-aldehyde dehydrogenase/aminobutyraldehyde dehydrogenase
MVDRGRAMAGGRGDHRGGKACATGRATFYEPSVVVNPAQDSEIVQREVFGPVITVQRFARRGAGARVGERT